MFFSKNLSFLSMVKMNFIENEPTYGVFNAIFHYFESYYKVCKWWFFQITFYYGNFNLLFPLFSFIITEGLFQIQKMVILSRVSYIWTNRKRFELSFSMVLKIRKIQFFRVSGQNKLMVQLGLKWVYDVKITSWSLSKDRRLVWNLFQTHRMNLEPF